MKSWQGWLGTASGVLGAISVALIALLTPTVVPYSSNGEVCSTIADGSTVCGTSVGLTDPPPTLNGGALIVIASTLLLFVGVLAGTWLDLGGKRRAGRLLLVICATLLTFAPPLIAEVLGFIGGLALTLTYPLVVLALITCILACVRRDKRAKQRTGGWG